MNITLLNASDNLIKVSVLGSYIVEYYADVKKKNKLNIAVYDPSANTVRSVAPQINKLAFIETVNCIWDSSKLYFSGCEITDNKTVMISVHNYDPGTGECRQVYQFERKLDILTSGKKIKIFILSENVLLVQTETSHGNVSENMIGNIEFDISLVL